MLQSLLARARALLVGVGLRVGEWLGVLGQAARWIGVKIIAFLVAAMWWLLAALRSLFVPTNRAPLDFLKHYASLIIVLTGFIALLWAAMQIAYPPLVITVAKLPTQLEQESWLNPEMPRTLMNQIERLRAVVKGDRDPAFEAVLNSPNISIKTGDFSLNVQEQILTPLGTLLGRGQGEVHLAVTCYHPGCLRASDAECREPIKKDAPIAPEHYLCLRLTADIQRGKLQRRVTLRLTLNNDTYEIEMARQMSRIAEAVTSVADPATAALYFYRRVRQEGDAARSLTNDPEVMAELRSEAFKAAEQAENQDTVSLCWAHSVRAHLAIDQREFSLAEAYLARARKISPWDHLRHGTFPADCDRLIAIAEIELSRQLGRPADFSAYPQHSKDDNEKRLAAAHDRIAGLLKQDTAALTGFARNRIDSTDLNRAAEYAQAEIGLGWFTKAEQCGLLDGRWAPPDPRRATGPEAAYDDALDPALKKDWFDTWLIIRLSLERLQKLSAEHPLSPLTRQAAMDFLETFAGNEVCADDVQAVGRHLYLAHPNDWKVTQLFARVTETAATKKSRNLRHPAGEADRGNQMLGYAKSLYERLVDIGEDKVGVIALSRLAFITEAFHADGGSTKPFGPVPETLLNVTRAWRRYQQQNYPTHTRHHAEFLVSFWGSLLLRFYPGVTDADLLSEVDTSDPSKKEQLRSAKANFAEFSRALRFLFPDTRATSLAQLPKLGGIGERIGCLCMLSRTAYKNELADFLIARIHGWQDVRSDMSKCQEDLIPAHDKLTYALMKKTQDEAERKFDVPNRQLNYIAKLEEALEDARAGNTPATEAARHRLESDLAELEAADQKTPQLKKVVTDALRAFTIAKSRIPGEVVRMQASLEKERLKVPALTKARDEADEVFAKARAAANPSRENWIKKEGDLKTAARLCRVSG